MPSTNKNTLFYSLALIFAGLNIFLFTEDIYWFTLLPAFVACMWLLVYYPGTALLIIAFATPLSVKFAFERFGASLYVPTEPFTIILTGLFWVHLLLAGKYDKRIFRHPLTLVIAVNLLWILVTSLSSSLPVVSLKFFISRFWFVSVFYFMVVQVFKDIRYLKAFLWLFSLSMCAVIVLTIYRHAGYGFTYEKSSKVMFPFFTDHGIYAAVISLVLPAMLYFFWQGPALGLSRWQRFIALGLFLIMALGVGLSYTRAAWIGLGVAAAAAVVFYLRIRFSTLAVIAVLALGVLAIFQNDIYRRLRSNKEASGDNIENHVQSIYNISTDASNTERINRWKSAWRMFQERPLTGWGPGTYMFQYAPFQLSHEMTVISTNAGTLGNAHSEYIGPLAESGVLGTLSFLGIVIVSLFISMKIMYNARERKVRVAAMVVILGLITYYVHGMLNNYLDTDKASIPFWAFLAMLTALDIYYRQGAEEKFILTEQEQHS